MEEKKQLSVGMWLLIIFGAFFVIGFLSLIFYKEGGPETGFLVWTSTDGVSFVSSSDFEIVRDKTKGFRSKDGRYTVKGQIKQNANRGYTDLMITLNLLDKNKNKVRQTSGLVFSNYLGNQIWEFEVSGNDADNIVTDYEIAYCYGF